MTVTANSNITIQTPDTGIVRFVGTTDATLTPKALYTNPGTDPVDLNSVTATNGATAHNVSLLLISAGTTYTLNTVAVAVNAGNNGTVLPVSFLSVVNWPGLPVDANGNPFLRVPGSGTISAQYATAQGTADTLCLQAIGGRF